MFSKSLDSKSFFVDDDGNVVVDLSEGIFDRNKSIPLYTLYRVGKDFEMRPDLISKSLYGTTDYTEIVLKQSLIPNPFAMEKDDVILAVSLSSIYSQVYDNIDNPTDSYNAIKKYHKYIDKSKIPTSLASEGVDIGITYGQALEPNISKTGNSGLTIKNGRIYFGSTDDTLIPADSSLVDCAVSGTTVGEFINATIKNSLEG